MPVWPPITVDADAIEMRREALCSRLMRQPQDRHRPRACSGGDLLLLTVGGANRIAARWDSRQQPRTVGDRVDHRIALVVDDAHLDAGHVVAGVLFGESEPEVVLADFGPHQVTLFLGDTAGKKRRAA